LKFTVEPWKASNACSAHTLAAYEIRESMWSTDDGTEGLIDKGF
jgi:hypothetical protein